MLRIRVSEEDYYYCATKGERGMSDYIRALLKPDKEKYFAENPLERNDGNKHPGWAVVKINKGKITITHRAFPEPLEIGFAHPDYLFFRHLKVGEVAD
jgi:hypothetical protein